MDWQNLAGSSIWSNEDGFGHQDDSEVGVTIPRQPPEGKCVSGPFKDVKLFHYNLTVHPHCLTRQFELTKSEDHGTFSGELMSPDAMADLARAQEYGTFRFGMEGIHDVIHNGVIGDLNTWSSANGTVSLKRVKRPVEFALTESQIPFSGSTTFRLTEFGGSGNRMTLKTGWWTTATRPPTFRPLRSTTKWNILGSSKTGLCQR